MLRSVWLAAAGWLMLYLVVVWGCLVVGGVGLGVVVAVLEVGEGPW